MGFSTVFNLLREGFWRLCFVVLLTSLSPQISAQEPRLRDFGSSLKKHTKTNQDGAAAGRRPDGGTADEVVRVETDLVVSDVMVVDSKGNAIEGFERGDFVVTEDGIPQEIRMFSLGDAPGIPRSIVLIIDYSSSQLPYIKTSIDAAKVLVDKLGPKDKMALVTDDLKLLVDFTQDKTLLKDSLESLKERALSKKYGKSLQYSALMATLNEMFSAEDIRPIVIFQTDGDQLRFLRGFSYRDVEALVEKSRATIYAIIPNSLIGLTEKERFQRYVEWRSFTGLFSVSIDLLRELSNQQLREHVSVGKLAKLSGGWPDSLDRPDQANEVYERIFADINNRYVIGYYPANKKHDGKRRAVKIEVRGHPEYIVWGRKTYFAALD